MASKSNAKKATKKTVAPVKKSVKAEYDFRTQAINPAGGRRRRAPKIEKHDEERVLTDIGRLEAINLARDLYRNHPQSHALIKSLRANAVGSEGKLRFHRSDDWYNQAQHYFNSRWARHADYVTGRTWRSMLQDAVASLTIDGDFVVFFDRMSGRLAFWEADQICDLDEAGFATLAQRGYQQVAGVIMRDGRVCGVNISHARGNATVPAADALTVVFDTAEEWEDSDWRLVYRSQRLRQVRGVSDMTSLLQTQLDAYEMLGYELQAAKVNSAQAAVVIDPPTVSSGIPSGFADPVDEETGEVDEDATVEAEKELAQADGLDRWSGGNIDYLEAGSSVVFPPANRPSTSVKDFLSWTGDLAGAALGLGHTYALSKADGSYSASRMDILLTWAHLGDLQQALEDLLCDWVAERVITRAIELGELPPAPDEDWIDFIAWTWPRPPSVDEGAEASAYETEIRLGLKSYRDILGPAWREALVQAGEEREFLHRIGLRHPQDETVAGAPTTMETDDGNKND